MKSRIDNLMLYMRTTKVTNIINIVLSVILLGIYGFLLYLIFSVYDPTNLANETGNALFYNYFVSLILDVILILLMIFFSFNKANLRSRGQNITILYFATYIFATFVSFVYEPTTFILMGWQSGIRDVVTYSLLVVGVSLSIVLMLNTFIKYFSIYLYNEREINLEEKGLFKNLLTDSKGALYKVTPTLLIYFNFVIFYFSLISLSYGLTTYNNNYMNYYYLLPIIFGIVGILISLTCVLFVRRNDPNYLIVCIVGTVLSLILSIAGIVLQFYDLNGFVTWACYETPYCMLLFAILSACLLIHLLIIHFRRKNKLDQFKDNNIIEK